MPPDISPKSTPKSPKGDLKSSNIDGLVFIKSQNIQCLLLIAPLGGVGVKRSWVAKQPRGLWVKSNGLNKSINEISRIPYKASLMLIFS